MDLDFLRVAAISPKILPADITHNVETIISEFRKVASEGAQIVAAPELCITGYTCGDLFRQEHLLEEAEKGLARITEATAGTDAALIVGIPKIVDSKLLNMAAVCADGEVKGFVGKRHIPEYNEFYERRRFSPDLSEAKIFDIAGVKVGVEICEDLWVPDSPSTKLALQGAEIIVNLSASNDLVGKYDYLRDLVKMNSAKNICGYLYVSAGFGESTTDVSYSSKAFIAENGKILAEMPRFQIKSDPIIHDIDLTAIRADRLNSSFRECAQPSSETISTGISRKRNKDLMHYVDPYPFVPQDNDKLHDRCAEISNIQAFGLAKRLDHIHADKIVVGISGGLDSTLALLVACKAFDLLGLDRKGIIGITMPGFGTSKRTKSNADTLMESLGITTHEIPIGTAVEKHFQDIGHDPAKLDITYENSQARERTQILMDYANKVNAIVLGTGDLSETALGWCTYNGDHMSMYAVNISIPKTLVKYLVSHYAQDAEDADLRKTLHDIVDTPISPELLPTDAEGKIAQKTEDSVGPYELHDFFLYHFLRYGRTPRAILSLAVKAFEGKFEERYIKHWLRTFYRRFFNQQFKRSCMPDGPKVGSVALSPRGDWRMPSDAMSASFLKELED